MCIAVYNKDTQRVIWQSHERYSDGQYTSVVIIYVDGYKSLILASHISETA